MKVICFQVMLLAVFQLSCQRSASVSDDSDTGDTNTIADVSTSSDSTDTESNDDSDSGDSSSSNDTTTEDTDQDTGSDTTPLPDPVENEWIFIEGGTFEMGYDGPDERYYNKFKPVHTVTLPSFEIQKTEVTVHQYRECVSDGACSEPHQTESECADSYYNNWLVPHNLNYPVSCIEQRQATEYCNWIGGRLLSEAEWEYAARGGGQDIMYPWGNDAPNCDLLAQTGPHYVGMPNCWSNGPLPVCSKPLGNSFHGLCDMSGNFGEWVADQLQTNLGYEGAPTDGSPWIIEDSKYAIVRSSDAFYETPAHQVYLRIAISNEDNYGIWVASVRCGRDPE